MFCWMRSTATSKAQSAGELSVSPRGQGICTLTIMRFSITGF